MSPAKTREVWRKLNNAIGVSTEDDQTGVRVGVFLYLYKNGASRVGNYKGSITTYTGKTFQASEIPFHAGRTEVRRFMRGCMDESYTALKELPLAQLAPKQLAKCAALGIAADDAFAIADWLDGCPKFTHSESAAHEKYRNYSLRRSKLARDGSSLEEVEEHSVNMALEAQGPIEQHGRTTGRAVQI